MKVGDLIRWRKGHHDRAGGAGYGIVVRVDPQFPDAVYIRWMDGHGDGLYPKSHKHLELVSESR